MSHWSLLSYLGNTFSAHGMSEDTSCFVVASYYRHYIENFASIIAHYIISSSDAKPFVLQTDTSTIGLKAVLELGKFT